MRRFHLPMLMRFAVSIFLAGVAARPIGRAVTRPVILASGPAVRTGLIIPLYIYPGPEWDRLILVKQTYSRVPILAVINPNSGPGSAPDPNYLNGIQSLRAAGITVLGYVYTNYAARVIDEVEADMSTYKSWYPLDGFFLDEMSNSADQETYYSDLNDFAKSLGMTFTMGNPATDTLPGYVGAVDSQVIYENPGLPALGSLAGWHTGYAKQNFALIAYAVNALDPAFVYAVSDYVGYLYLTDDLQPNPYDTLPSYLDALAAALNNRPPHANNAYSTPAGTALSVPVPGVLAQDSDPDGDALTALLVGDVTHGTLTLNPDGSFDYAPASGFSGLDTFTYQAQDALGGRSNTATVTIQVLAP